jgi:ankyrin repeat protein
MISFKSEEFFGNLWDGAWGVFGFTHNRYFRSPMAGAVQVPEPTPLLDACGQGDLCLVQRLVAEDPRRVATERNVHGATALIVASWSGHLHIVMWLVDAVGAAPQTERSTNRTPAFLAACERGHLGVAQWLWRDGGSGLAERNDFGDSAFILACANNRLDVAQWLYGTCLIDPHASENINGANALVAAAWFGHLEVVQWVLIEVPESDQFVAEIVKTSCQRGHLHILVWIVDTYAVNVALEHDQTVAQWLAEHHCRDFSGMTPFLFSCEGGQLEVAKWIASANPTCVRSTTYVRFVCLAQRAKQ